LAKPERKRQNQISQIVIFFIFILRFPQSEKFSNIAGLLDQKKGEEDAIFC
jgi:hypothetical protein